MNSRRTFVAGAGAAVSSVVAGKAAPSDRIRVAVLGVNGRGQDHIQGIMPLPDAEVVMLCDPDKEVLNKQAAAFEKRSR
jgi:hypothetical protein